jgi:arginine repressor
LNVKIKRQRAILDLIKKEEITTQEELSEYLNRMGFKVTQATVSRDIKELKLLKVPSEHSKGSKYGYLETRNTNPASHAMNRLTSIFNDTVLSVDYAVNLVVIKTLEGMAQGVAAVLDALNDDSIMGTIAGDNTIMIITKSEVKAKELSEKLKNLLNFSN